MANSHDNAPAQSAQLAQQFLTKQSTSQVRWPPNSPDMASYNVFLFPTLK